MPFFKKTAHNRCSVALCAVLVPVLTFSLGANLVTLGRLTHNILLLLFLICRLLEICLIEFAQIYLCRQNLSMFQLHYFYPSFRTLLKCDSWIDELICNIGQQVCHNH